jgi:hypothetical protein
VVKGTCVISFEEEFEFFCAWALAKIISTRRKLPINLRVAAVEQNVFVWLAVFMIQKQNVSLVSIVVVTYPLNLQIF